MICEQCKAEGEPSRVMEEGTEQTCIGFHPFYDEHGRPHVHDPNNHCTAYRCSRGHRWQRHWKAPCPECGEWWLPARERTDLYELYQNDLQPPFVATCTACLMTITTDQYWVQVRGCRVGNIRCLQCGPSEAAK